MIGVASNGQETTEHECRKRLCWCAFGLFARSEEVNEYGLMNLHLDFVCLDMGEPWWWLLSHSMSSHIVLVVAMLCALRLCRVLAPY
jgi:hypothetical protein